MCTALPQVYRATADERFFFNNTGTGNDVSFTGGDGRYTKRLVTDSLGLWHNAYGIDGFRFDLARILADGSDSAADWVDNDRGLRRCAPACRAVGRGRRLVGLHGQFRLERRQQPLDEVDRAVPRPRAALLAVRACATERRSSG